MIRGILGKKLGMTQIFDSEGNVIPVTLVEAGPCTVLEVKQEAKKVTLGYGSVKPSRLKKPQEGYFKKLGQEAKKIIVEMESSDNSEYTAGQEVKVDLFKRGDYVDVSGVSIGKGFQGGMKRHGWSGGPAGHGSMHHRRVGSIGASAYPSKVVKGFPMPGQMGNKKATTQGLWVMAVDAEKNLLMLKGAVPGPTRGTVQVCLSKKKAFKDPDAKKEFIVRKVNPMKQSKAKAGKKK